MKKTFALVDEKRGIVQITTDDERFYVRDGADPQTGNPTHIWLPSASWISSYCPKGIEFTKWVAEQGFDEAQRIKEDRGKYGTRVHKAVELLVNGETVALDEELPTGDGKTVSTLTAEEYTAVNHFATWWADLSADHTVEMVLSEHLIWCPALGFAGTTDLLLRVDGEHWLIDLKTSKYIGDSYKAQLSAYRRALELEGIATPIKQFILQVGYPYNKKGFKLTEIEDSYHLFEAAKVFWAEANNGKKPNQVHLPLKVSLGIKKNMSKGKVTKKTKTKTK